MRTNNIGLYRVVLRPEAEAELFEHYMLTEVFPEAEFFAHTPVNLTHRLLKFRPRQYVWMIDAYAVADGEVAFTEAVSAVQDKIALFGLCSSLETFVEIGEPISA